MCYSVLFNLDKMESESKLSSLYGCYQQTILALVWHSVQIERERYNFETIFQRTSCESSWIPVCREIVLANESLLFT